MVHERLQHGAMGRLCLEVVLTFSRAMGAELGGKQQDQCGTELADWAHSLVVA